MLRWWHDLPAIKVLVDVTGKRLSKLYSLSEQDQSTSLKILKKFSKDLHEDTHGQFLKYNFRDCFTRKKDKVIFS